MGGTSMTILRDRQPVGTVSGATGQLTSADPALNALWNKWAHDGIKVLGPPATEPPAGVFADQLYIFHPGPDCLGIVAIELQRSGYEWEFEGEAAARDGG